MFGSLALLLVACATAPPPPPSQPVAVPAPAPGPPAVAQAGAAEQPASVLDERRRAAEDPRLSCPEKDASRCHWVDLWRRHLVEQLALPETWTAAHVSIDFIQVDDSPDQAVFTVGWLLSVDWVKLPIQERVVVRSAPGAAFDSDDAVLGRYAGMKTGGDGYHVFEMKPFGKLIGHDQAVAALAACHGARPGPLEQISLAEPKKLVLTGSKEIPGDSYHCWAAAVDLETGKLLQCGQVLCRVD